MGVGAAVVRDYWLPPNSVWVAPTVAFRITSIPEVKLRQGFIPHYVTFSLLLTGLVCMTPPQSTLLSPASVLLFKMKQRRQFLVASSVPK
jgi:hypothetical protein